MLDHKNNFRLFVNRIAARIFLSASIILLCFTIAVRVRSVLMVRRFEQVLSGLKRIQLDQTPESDLLKIVPYLTRGQSFPGYEPAYYLVISNEDDWLSNRLESGVFPQWMAEFAGLLGYRPLFFSARVLIHGGRVSSISFGISNNLIAPRALGYLMSADSVHGTWYGHESPFEVTADEDESLPYRISGQYRIYGNENALNVKYAFDAPPEITSHIFTIDLTCFWGLFRCSTADQVAPLVWADKSRIDQATMYRLQGGREPCPDRILADRVRYFPDVQVLLLEVTKSRKEHVSEDGGVPIDEYFVDYRLVEAIRGRSKTSWQNISHSRTILSPTNFR